MSRPHITSKPGIDKFLSILWIEIEIASNIDYDRIFFSKMGPSWWLVKKWTVARFTNMV